MDHDEHAAAAVPVPDLRDLDERLAELDERPLVEHPAAFDKLHRRLAGSLDELDPRTDHAPQAPLPGPPDR
ncbi:MAG: hypothetical protein ACR2F6_09345 [Mycobacteriales bacterium]